MRTSLKTRLAAIEDALGDHRRSDAPIVLSKAAYDAMIEDGTLSPDDTAGLIVIAGADPGAI